MNTVGAQTSPLTALRERIQPNLSHHFDPSGTVAAEERLDIEVPLGNDHCAGGAARVYNEIPWGERRAYINVDSYDRRRWGL